MGTPSSNVKKQQKKDRNAWMSSDSFRTEPRPRLHAPPGRELVRADNISDILWTVPLKTRLVPISFTLSKARRLPPVQPLLIQQSARACAAFSHSLARLPALPFVSPRSSQFLPACVLSVTCMFGPPVCPLTVCRLQCLLLLGCVDPVWSSIPPAGVRVHTNQPIYILQRIKPLGAKSLSN